MHVPQADHAATFDGGHDMGLRLAGNSGALATTATSEGYGDCAARVNTSRRNAGFWSGRAAPAAPHAAVTCAGASDEDAPPAHLLERRGPTRNGTSFGHLLSSLCLFAAVLFAGIAAAHAEPLRIAMLGDSLTAGFGLSPDQALPAKLEKALK